MNALTLNEWIARATNGVMRVPAGFVLNRHWNREAGQYETTCTSQDQFVEVEIDPDGLAEVIRSALKNKTHRSVRGAFKVVARGVATHAA